MATNDKKKQIGLVLHPETRPLLDMLTLEECGILLHAFYAYSLGENDEADKIVSSKVLRAVYETNKCLFDKDRQRYIEKCQKLSQNFASKNGNAAAQKKLESCEDKSITQTTVREICKEYDSEEIFATVLRRVETQLNTHEGVHDIRAYTKKCIDDVKRESENKQVKSEECEEEKEYYLFNPSERITKAEHDRQLCIWKSSADTGEEWAKKFLLEYEKKHKEAI